MTRIFAAVAMLLVVTCQTQTFGQTAERSNLIEDVIAELQRKIDVGEVQFKFDEPQGYLRSLLKTLNIPVSSQSLVFSKSSFQMALISPRAPRAIYFNDDVYVGFVQDGPVLEVVSV